jgi:cyclophilin family peptidyl-prolyl cis-trans isomerase
MQQQTWYYLGAALVIVGLLAYQFKLKPNQNSAPVESNSDSVTIQPTSPTPVASATVKKQAERPSMQIDKTKKYTAILHTDKGDITIDLAASATPITVNNFVTLAKNNFYNNTIFHRTIKGFMIQGGDPKGNGTGDPGYKFDDEPFTGEYTRGTIAMANSGPNTNGSQFFIMHADYPLPPNYVIFGKVSKGLEVVDEIATAPVKASFSGEMSTPISPAKVKTIEIIEAAK